jgi:death-on-curing protein
MKEPVWISKQEIIAFHSKQIQEHGGLPGVRDDGLLESAIARPQQVFAYSDVNIFELAASYAHGIIKNHPFLDGNKRTAIITAGIFLIVNGWMLEVSEEELYLQTIALAESALSEKSFSRWLKESCQKIE